MPLPVLTALPLATHTEYLNLTYRSDLKLVVLRWLRDVSLPELQLAHQAALKLALHHQATHWFVDVRRRLQVNNTHTRWVCNDFFPHTAALLPAGALRIVYLMSPSRQCIINAHPDLQATVEHSQSASQPYRLRVFLDEASAMSWLFEGNH